jgi:hypothetical protein
MQRYCTSRRTLKRTARLALPLWQNEKGRPESRPDFHIKEHQQL